MTKNKKVVKQKLRAVKKDKHASHLLKVLQATGLFRWERPSTRAEEAINILKERTNLSKKDIYNASLNLKKYFCIFLFKFFI